jgi:hypothetical protein
METVKVVPLSILNQQLDENVPAADLNGLASRGMRGELIFAVPCVLEKNPRLLGYYRLLLGYSQKELYNKAQLARFKASEEKGVFPDKTLSEVPALCKALCQRASELLAGLGLERVTATLLDELTLLTLGPQLRGSRNTTIGKEANHEVFCIIEQAVGHAVTKRSSVRLELRNSSQREVVIAFSSDPDISIVESPSAKAPRNIVAIEIKGGADRSNIWNRLGEAEKSHQSAKKRGFVEFWTIFNVANLDLEKAREKSPTTHRFYNLRDLKGMSSEHHAEFCDRLVSLVGIKAKKRRPQ